MKLRYLLGTSLALISPSLAMAEVKLPSEKRYIESNVIGIFYHEFGHVLIDLWDVSIRRRKEEDAADAISVLMVDAGFEEEDAAAIVRDIATTFKFDSEDFRPSFFGAHSSDKNRYEATLCLFYGADTDGRAEIVDDTEIATRRLKNCEETRAEADETWGSILDEATNENKARDWVRLRNSNHANGSPADIMMQTVANEVAFVNNWLVLPQVLEVSLQSCGEANAYYDPETVEIIMCTEYADYLFEQAKRDP